MPRPTRLPKPHVKPSISISLDAPKAWQLLDVVDVKAGDIVQGHNRGWVTDVGHTEKHVWLYFKNGERESFYPGEKVTVFTEVHSGHSG